MIFVNELRARLDCYFRIVVRNVRDTVPRLIGHFLVRAVQNKMQIELFKRLNTMFETVNRSMGEPLAIIQERKALTAQLATLRDAERVLTRDPEITNMISTSDDELLIELKQEKAEEAAGKKYDQQGVIEKCMKSVIPESKLKNSNKSSTSVPIPVAQPKPANSDKTKVNPVLAPQAPSQSPSAKGPVQAPPAKGPSQAPPQAPPAKGPAQIGRAHV